MNLTEAITLNKLVVKSILKKKCDYSTFKRGNDILSTSYFILIFFYLKKNNVI